LKAKRALWVAPASVMLEKARGIKEFHCFR
jgi:hypothetical protein